MSKKNLFEGADGMRRMMQMFEDDKLPYEDYVFTKSYGGAYIEAEDPAGDLSFKQVDVAIHYHVSNGEYDPIAFLSLHLQVDPRDEEDSETAEEIYLRDAAAFEDAIDEQLSKGKYGMTNIPELGQILRGIQFTEQGDQEGFTFRMEAEVLVPPEKLLSLGYDPIPPE